MVAILVIVVSLGAFAAYYFDVGTMLEKEAPVASPVKARSEALRVVGHSIDAARLPLEVEEVAPPADPMQDEAALTAVWEQGKPVILRGELSREEWSVFLALQKRNLSNQAIHEVVTAMGEVFNFRKSRPGDQWYAEVDADGVITLFRYQTSPEDVWEAVRTEDGSYRAGKKEVAVDRRQESTAGSVASSLWQSFEESGASPQLAASFIDVFAHTIDFSTETQPGDEFALVYEKIFLNGEFLRHGRILAASYRGESGEYYGFYHEESEGEGGYYDRDGESLEGQFLKSPLGTVRITSQFGRRFHPVLKKMKMHAGVDYGAPTGTPVQAVADGKVTFAGWKGANGKLVALEHAGGYTTYYAHLSKIARGIKPGKRVTKKTIIGKVGSTGRSTGPHLHFGMKKHGKYINPITADLPRGTSLSGRAKERFQRSVVEPMLKQLERARPVAAAR